VQDPARQADAVGELLVDVDRVEVTRCVCVADRDVCVGGDLELDPLAGLPDDAPRTMLVQVPVQTASPRWLRDTDSNT